VLQRALGEALDAFLRVLDRYTLADLVGPERALAGLLDIHLPPTRPELPAAARKLMG